VFSSRKIERRLHEDLALRMLAAGNFPRQRTMGDFRAFHLKELSELFVQVVRLAREMGLAKLGTVAIDGTKVKANASLPSSMQTWWVYRSQACHRRSIPAWPGPPGSRQPARYRTRSWCRPAGLPPGALMAALWWAQFPVPGSRLPPLNRTSSDGPPAAVFRDGEVREARVLAWVAIQSARSAASPCPLRRQSCEVNPIHAARQWPGP